MIYQQMHDMILFGTLAPGQPVTINGLTKKIGAGSMPVRESIRRLIAQGALESTGTRRVVVPEITKEKLEQINFLRCNIEPHLARLAADKKGKYLIPNLKKLDLEIDEAIEAGDVEKYMEYNYKFHFAIYQAAENEILSDVVHSLWLKAGPSLRIVCGKVGTSNLPDMHEEAIKALQDDDPVAFGEAINKDISQGMKHIQLSLK